MRNEMVRNCQGGVSFICNRFHGSAGGVRFFGTRGGEI